MRVVQNACFCWEEDDMKRLLMVLLAAMMVFSAAMAEEDNHYDAIDYVGERGYVAVQRDGLWGIIDQAS